MYVVDTYSHACVARFRIVSNFPLPRFQDFIVFASGQRREVGSIVGETIATKQTYTMFSHFYSWQNIAQVPRITEIRTYEISFSYLG